MSPSPSVNQQWRLAKDDGSIVLAPELKGPICQKGDGALGVKRRRSELILPEDILYHIHSLMSMRDAACAALVSWGFLRSWRFYPNLVFDLETLGINEDENIDEITTRDFICRIDHIIKNHAGIGLKTFSLRTYPCDVDPSNVDRWLQVAITPGIKEFELRMENKTIEYNFPCLLLSAERGSSLQSFSLDGCAFHPSVEVGCLSSLTRVELSSVHITGEELCGFLSKSLALEQLDLYDCSDIVTLKIPSVLLRLSCLFVQDCATLELIESNAPNLLHFKYNGHPNPIHISLGDPLRLRRIEMSSSESNMLCCARVKLPAVAPNLQTLLVTSHYEVVNTPMVLGKFIHLKFLEVVLVRPDHSPNYDFCSLVSFLDGSPALDTFILRLEIPAIRHDSVIEDSGCSSSHPRLLTQQQHSHANLKNVTITGFCSARSMVELTNYILLNALSLECLTLDTSRGHERKLHKSTVCMQMFEKDLVEVQRARLAIARYVERNVPRTVNLRLIEPCSECLS